MRVIKIFKIVKVYYKMSVHDSFEEDSNDSCEMCFIDHTYLVKPIKFEADT